MAKAQRTQTVVITLTLTVEEAEVLYTAIDTISETDLIDDAADLQILNDIGYELFLAKEDDA